MLRVIDLLEFINNLMYADPPIRSSKFKRYYNSNMQSTD